jgi:hypothetical protein
MTVAGGNPQGPALAESATTKANGEIRSPFYWSVTICGAATGKSHPGRAEKIFKK